MKFIRTLFKISFSETFLLFALFLILINVPTFIFTWIKGSPRLLLNDASWMMQFGFPVIYSLIFTAVNRRGVLKISMFDDSKALTEKIESVVLKKGYKATDSNTENKKYIRKTKFSRFLNNFFNENIEIKVADDEVSIFARKNILDPVKMKLKFNT